jgi:nucleoside-diphosphate-sugar epimerase
MRVLVAGASGAVGKQLIPQLALRGHEIAGLVRSATGAGCVAARGATPIVADALNRAEVWKAIGDFRPDAVIHQLTALAANLDMRDFDAAFAQTNRLRTEGTDNLLSAAREFGVRRFVAQSFCGSTYARRGGNVKTEDDPLDPHPPAAFQRTFQAIRYLERVTCEARDVAGVCLRYGFFYGPGTSLSKNGSTIDQIRRRRLPVVGHGNAIWSLIHSADAASACVAALESDAMGYYNVVDDEPVAIGKWLPEFARIIGAKPPFRIPAFVARLMLPEHLFVMMTSLRGASNARFKQTFAWQPSFPTWREGFRALT